eukprot:CAMPEP_0204195788 /NCGR_PEP_ID=MMETSP0361-20130328/63350_1 /ASSEMBLY_ACC=CAM_ASM_000343 /TAXON_ID=268821 /ORGANISM="Scrippsiella Hangoei, Strain SHTV-5" /LENGTH=87 /DNA_ID=CAMNT_0051157421 /DNA_START=653 /DNA_END=920 /DNA_ORIENTATION=-
MVLGAFSGAGAPERSHDVCPSVQHYPRQPEAHEAEGEEEAEHDEDKIRNSSEKLTLPVNAALVEELWQDEFQETERPQHRQTFFFSS